MTSSANYTIATYAGGDSIILEMRSSGTNAPICHTRAAQSPLKAAHWTKMWAKLFSEPVMSAPGAPKKVQRGNETRQIRCMNISKQPWPVRICVKRWDTFPNDLPNHRGNTAGGKISLVHPWLLPPDGVAISSLCNHLSIVRPSVLETKHRPLVFQVYAQILQRRPHSLF